MRRALPLCLLLGACLAQNPPPEIRYFHPALPEVDEGDGGSEVIPLYLGRITAAAHLHEEMVWRISDVELGFDDLNRWVEDPALLVREALELVLYQEAGFRYSSSGGELEAEFHLRRFEERPGPEPEVCVQLFMTARGGGAPTRRREFHVHEPADDDGPEAAARAMGAALYRAAREVAADLRG